MGSRLLIAIPTAETYSGNATSPNRDEAARRAACRETWLRDSPADYRLFYGAGKCDPALDEVVIDVPEGYGHLSTKFVRICQWALERDYDFLLRVDTDAYVYVDRLLRSGFGAYDYSGYTIDYPRHLAHARYCSGAGWTLSRRGMELVVTANVTNEADDFWTGKVMYNAGIPCHRDTRFCCGFEPHFVPLAFLPERHSAIVLHALTPEGIREVHSRPYPGDDITPPERSLFEPAFNFHYGRRDAACDCGYCRG